MFFPPVDSHLTTINGGFLTNSTKRDLTVNLFFFLRQGIGGFFQITRYDVLDLHKLVIALVSGFEFAVRI